MIFLCLIDRRFVKQYPDGLRKGHPDDPHVQPEIAIAHIEGIELVAVKDAFEIPGRSSESLYLRQSGNTGLKKIPEFISWNDVGEFLTIRVHMWSWPHDAHVTEQDIKELGKFIQT